MINNGKKLVIALLVALQTILCIGLLHAAGAQISDPGKMMLFSQANEAFGQANSVISSDPEAARALYQKALLRYRKLAEEGIHNGKLFYNIGNTYFRLGQLGKAIANYRRAEQYIPDDENLRQNLDYALGQRQDKIEPKEEKQLLKTLFFWHYDLTVPVRAGLFAFFYAGFWITAAMLVKRRNTGILCSALALFLLAASLASSLLIERRHSLKTRPGVVIAGEISARKGDGESYQPSFQKPLHEGTEFVLVEDRGQWFYIELEDGRRCWIPADAAEILFTAGTKS